MKPSFKNRSRRYNNDEKEEGASSDTTKLTRSQLNKINRMVEFAKDNESMTVARDEDATLIFEAVKRLWSLPDTGDVLRL